MQKKILLAFDDPGGGLAVSSLIDKLMEQDLILKIYSGKLSRKFLKERKIKFEKIDSNISKEIAKEMINEFKPDVLVTGTGGGNAEQELRNVAFERNISSIVVLDFWKDYPRRWLYATYNTNEMNNKVCVMDELTKCEMIEENFPEKNLIVTGHPYLDYIFNYDRNDLIDDYDKDDDNKTDLNNEYDKSNIKLNNFLYLSQPFDVIGIKDYNVHPLKILMEALKKLNRDKITLTIKLHPNEKKSDDLIDLVNLSSDKLEILFADEDSSLKKLMSECGIVIGYNTIAMFEARAFHKRTISLNVVRIKNSLIEAMNKAGIEIIPANENDILECLKKDTDENIYRRGNIFQGGIENCVKVIFDEIQLN